VLNAGDTLFWQLLGAGLLCPLGARAGRWTRSGGAPRWEGDPAENDRFTGPASALLLTVVIAVYVSNAVVKLSGEAWPAGRRSRRSSGSRTSTVCSEG